MKPLCLVLAAALGLSTASCGSSDGDESPVEGSSDASGETALDTGSIDAAGGDSGTEDSTVFADSTSSDSKIADANNPDTARDGDATIDTDTASDGGAEATSADTLLDALDSSNPTDAADGGVTDSADTAVTDSADAAVDSANAVDTANAGDAADAADSADTAVADASGTDTADAAASNDPFDFGSCPEPALTNAEALAMLGAATRSKLADATLMRRTRSCSGATENTCGAWGTPVVHSQALLTYSGGVTTDYKTFNFPTHLILFTQTGSPRFTIRHQSDYQHDATRSDRGVVFSLGADPMVNTYPIIYVWDFNPAPNRYDDLQGLLGDDGYLHAALHCARVVFKSGLSTEIAALYRY